jgi:hypothetical protein
LSTCIFHVHTRHLCFFLLSLQIYSYSSVLSDRCRQWKQWVYVWLSSIILWTFIISTIFMMGVFLVEEHIVVVKEGHIRKMFFYCCFFGTKWYYYFCSCLFISLSFTFLIKVFSEIQKKEKRWWFLLWSLSVCVIVFVLVILDFSTSINLKTTAYYLKKSVSTISSGLKCEAR